METVRDLGRAEPWQDSLERSLARRGGRSTRTPTERTTRAHAHPGEHARADRRTPRTRPPARAGRHTSDVHQSDAHAPRPRPRARAARHRAEIRRRRLTAAGSGGGVLTLMLLAIVLPSAFADRVSRSASHSVHRAAYRTGARTAGAAIDGMLPASNPQPPACHPTATATGYANPLAHAKVRGERVDQGVDYAGTGSLSAVGAGRVTYVGTSGTGWPGAYLQYRLLDGPNAGCYVYYAEGVTPLPSVQVGDTVTPGETLATIIPGWPTGVEVGWGSGDSTKTYAAKDGGWTAQQDADSHASAAGKSFSALIAALGGPPGKIEG